MFPSKTTYIHITTVLTERPFLGVDDRENLWKMIAVDGRTIR